MENRLNRYVNQTFLIVDDFMEFRHSLKRMIEGMGGHEIDLAASGDEAVESYGKKHQDIVLIDYNLGESSNGLQVLEELRYKEILRHDSIVILITGETSMEMIQSAIDVNPDDCLPKPFTKATLKTRLDRAYEKKQAMKLVFQALNDKDYLKAISCCDYLISKKSKYTIACHRIKADCYLRLGQPADAMAIYDVILERREISWALLGRARCKIHSSMYVEAIADLDRIIDVQKFSVDAYDQKVEALLAIGDYENAYKVLQATVSISNNSAVRQRKLAQLAIRYHHYETASAALRKAISLSKHSSAKKPEDYLNLAQVLSMIQSGNLGAASRRAPSELSRLLSQMHNEFAHNIQLGLACDIHAAVFLYMSKKTKEASIKIKQAHLKLEDLPDEFKPFLLDEIKFAHRVCPDLDGITALYDDFYANTKAKEQESDLEKASAYNNQGMNKFRDRDYDSAYKAFRSAHQNAPENVNIALNLMQAMTKLIGRGKDQPDFSELLESCARAMQSLANNDQRKSHFKLLFNHIRSHVVGRKVQQRQD